MRPPKNSWPETDGATGALFFAQHLIELLSDDTFESFRAMTMDTLARVDEAIVISNDVLRNMVPAKVLEPVVQEIRWSLEQDPVAKVVAPHEVQAFIEHTGSPRAATELSQLLTFLGKRLRPKYCAALESEILSHYANPKTRMALRRATAFYCSHLINAGFSREAILDEVETRFFSADIQRVRRESLTSFFRKFESREWRFDVFVPVNEGFGEYLAGLDMPVRPARRLPAHARRSFVPALAQDQSVLVHRVEAKDRFAAATMAEQRLTSIKAVAMLAPKSMDCIWQDEVYVCRMMAENGRLVRRQDFSFRQETVPSLSGRSMLNLKRHTRRILSSFDPPSTERLLSSINTSAIARGSTNIENALISVWSSIEVLFSAPPPDVARIVHFEKLLVPCVTYRYARRQFVAAYDELLRHYRRKFQTIVDQVFPGETIDRHTKFIFLLLLPQFQTQRTALCELLEANPLALHRTWKLTRDFASATEIGKTLDHHANRVRWQIHRIYRARNHLVHSGRVPAYLPSLVTNAYEYYRAAVGTIVGYARLDTDKSNMDQTVAEIGFEADILLKAVKVAGPYDRRYLERIFTNARDTAKV